MVGLRIKNQDRVDFKVVHSQQVLDSRPLRLRKQRRAGRGLLALCYYAVLRARPQGALSGGVEGRMRSPRRKFPI